MSNCRFDFNTWVWLQYRGCFPGRADTPTVGCVHWHRTGAVVQRPGHRGRTDDYTTTERTLKTCFYSYSQLAFSTLEGKLIIQVE